MTDNRSKEMTRLAISALEDKKAEDISIIDISEVSVLADYFLIGYQSGNWILMDYGDIIVHIFDRENRLFYDLERIWRDGKRVDLEEFK